MYRNLFPLVLLALAAVCGAAPAAPPPKPASLPLRQVVLFSSGVGYFQRSGKINGSATVNLAFRAEQVNDILKSLVLFDPAGNVRPVTYATQAPIARQLRPTGVPANAATSLGDLLRQFQGARVRLEAGRTPIEGRIVSVSVKTVVVDGRNTTQVEVLNVLTAAGLRAVRLEQVSQIRLLDARLDRDLRQGLALLAAGLNDERKQMALHFAAGGAREVRAGYLQEVPVWKTSYRLVLDEGAKPYLQGWAIVENTSDEDWNNVRLSLISGRPVSFIQNLYQPLYVPRPEVAPQVIGSPTPQTYGEALEEKAEPAPAGPGGFGGGLGGAGFGGGGAGGGFGGFSGGMPGQDPLNRPVTLDLRSVPLREALARLFAGTGLNYAVDSSVPDVPVTYRFRDVPLRQALRSLIRIAAAGVPGLTYTTENGLYMIKPRTAPPAAGESVLGYPLDNSLILRGVASQAEGSERGALFEYAIRQPLSLTKGQAALVPIVVGDIEGEALSIYDPASDASHALNGFRLKNSTGLHLAGGPITIFRSGIYAGDAQIQHLQPGDDRLLSYAVDLDLVTAHEPPQEQEDVVSITAKSGVLTVTHRQQRTNKYTLRNKANAAKTVLVEQRIEPEFHLAAPARPDEQTPESYRFLVPVAAKKTAELTVVTERPVSQAIALIDADLNAIVEYARNTHVSEALRAAMQELVQRRRKITDLQAQRTELENEIKSFDQEQSRIRQNMGQLDRNSALYQQYVKKLTDQETRIEALHDRIAALRATEDAAQKQLRQFADGLTVG